MRVFLYLGEWEGGEAWHVLSAFDFFINFYNLIVIIPDNKVKFFFKRS